jgi:hypothetical protein
MGNSLRRIGAVDASKFHRHALARLFDGVAFTDLVTDVEPPAHVAAAMAAAGTRITVAAEPGGQARAAEQAGAVNFTTYIDSGM